MDDAPNPSLSPIRRSRTRRRRRQRANAAARRNFVERLPSELLAEIHSRLGSADFLRRLAFAWACRESSGHLLKEETPCLLLPVPGKTKGSTGSDETEDDTDDLPGHGRETQAYTRAAVFSLADRRAATVRTPDPAMRGQAVLGSSCGWLVTADRWATLRMVNPVTGAQADLPDIATGSLPFARRGEYVDIDPRAFLEIRFGGVPPPPPDGSKNGLGAIAGVGYTMRVEQMRQSCYRKVVLSASPRPGSYAAMLILEPDLGAPAFATAEDPAWRLAPSRDGVEDAIHHGGRFLSITHSGVVEAWDRNADTGEYTSTAVAPRLPAQSMANADDCKLHRKYLVAGPGGRLMAVLKRSVDVQERQYEPKITRVFFTVMVLDEAARLWEEASDIGDAALFVGINASLCVSATEHRGVSPSCVYFTDDEVGNACLQHEGPGADRSYYRSIDDSELRRVGVYSLRRGSVEEVETGLKHGEAERKRSRRESEPRAGRRRLGSRLPYYDMTHHASLFLSLW